MPNQPEIITKMLTPYTAIAPKSIRAIEGAGTENTSALDGNPSTLALAWHTKTMTMATMRNSSMPDCRRLSLFCLLLLVHIGVADVKICLEP